MYRTIVKRAGLNPLTGKKQYKVYDIDWHYMTSKPFVFSLFNEKYLQLTTHKRHQVGTFVNPRRALGI